MGAPCPIAGGGRVSDRPDHTASPVAAHWNRMLWAVMAGRVSEPGAYSNLRWGGRRACRMPPGPNSQKSIDCSFGAWEGFDLYVTSTTKSKRSETTTPPL